jgi:hypothetical protein
MEKLDYLLNTKVVACSMHCRFFICDLYYCETKVMKMGSSCDAAVWLKCLLFYRSSGWSVGLFYLLIISYVWLFCCWELLMVRWCFFGPCLTLWLDNRRRQVNVALWSTRFHLLFELPPLNFKINSSQITW